MESMDSWNPRSIIHSSVVRAIGSPDPIPGPHAASFIRQASLIRQAFFIRQASLIRQASFIRQASLVRQAFFIRQASFIGQAFFIRQASFSRQASIIRQPSILRRALFIHKNSKKTYFAQPCDAEGTEVSLKRCPPHRGGGEIQMDHYQWFISINHNQLSVFHYHP